MNVSVGLRQFFDIAVLCHRKKDFDWNWIHGEMTKLGLNRFAETVFALDHEWFDVLPPGEVESLKIEFVDDATDQIFRSGVFGFADEQNLGKAIENALVNSKLPYPLRKVRVLLKKAFPPFEAMRYYPWCSFVNKGKLLLPIAWLVRWIYGLTQNRTVWKNLQKIYRLTEKK